MQRAFQPIPERGVGKRPIAEPGAIERAIGLQAFGAELGDDRPMAGGAGTDNE
jgi:hypothetical protein